MHNRIRGVCGIEVFSLFYCVFLVGGSVLFIYHLIFEKQAIAVFSRYFLIVLFSQLQSESERSEWFIASKRVKVMYHFGSESQRGGGGVV